MKKIFAFTLLGFIYYTSYSQNNFTYNDDLSSAPADTVAKQVSKVLTILREFRFQAYMQTEWQRADTSGYDGAGPTGTDGVGAFQGGIFPAAANNRFLQRRSRFKLSFEHKNKKDLKIFDFAFQLEAYDYGRNTTAVKEFYGRVIDPWTGWVSFQGGIFTRPFGFETASSPAFQESPEFARVNQTLLPNEAELGAALIVESPAKFEKFYLRADASVVNGQGIGVGFQTGTYQNGKDIIARLKFGKMWQVKSSKLGFNATASYYNGSVLQTTSYVYDLAIDSTGKYYYNNIGDPKMIDKVSYKREYVGVHLELKADYPIGITTLRGEYITGQQPGGATSSLAPIGGQYNSLPVSDIYLRKFNGGLLLLTQSFKQKVKDHTIMHDFTFKYDWYDPQSRVDGMALDYSRGFSNTDLKYTTYGFGYSFVPYNWFKLMIWYDYVVNESSMVQGYEKDYKKDNVLTIRSQFYIDSWWFNPKSKYKDNLMSKKY